MTRKNKITDTDIRNYVRRRDGVTQVWIKQTGEIYAKGVMPNTHKVGWFFAGWRENIAKQLEAEQSA